QAPGGRRAFDLAEYRRSPRPPHLREDWRLDQSRCRGLCNGKRSYSRIARTRDAGRRVHGYAAPRNTLHWRVGMSTIAINGTEIYYEDTGSGRPVLLIHGMCGDASVWSDQARRLGGRFRCVSYDRRGHSRSPLGSVEQRTVELHADDAVALIRSLDLAP